MFLEFHRVMIGIPVFYTQAVFHYESCCCLWQRGSEKIHPTGSILALRSEPGLAQWNIFLGVSHGFGSRIKVWGFLHGPVVKNPPWNAEDTGSSMVHHLPQGNAAYAPQLLKSHSGAWKPELLSPCAAATKPASPRAGALQQGKSPQYKTCTSQLKGSLCSLTRQLEKAHVQQQRHSTAKNE